MNFKFMRRVREREREIRQLVIVENQIDVSFWCVCPVFDNKSRQNIGKVVCGSTRLSPRGSTATLTLWWRNSWSTTGQTDKKLTVNLLTFNWRNLKTQALRSSSKKKAFWRQSFLKRWRHDNQVIFLPEVFQTQFQNDRWFLGFQISWTYRGRKTFAVFQGENMYTVFKFVLCSVDGAYIN